MRYHCVAGAMSVMSNPPAARSVGGGGNSSAKTVACRHTCEAQRHVLKSLLFVLQGRQRRALAESIIGCDQERQHRPHTVGTHLLKHLAEPGDYLMLHELAGGVGVIGSARDGEQFPCTAALINGLPRNSQEFRHVADRERPAGLLQELDFLL